MIPIIAIENSLVPAWVKNLTIGVCLTMSALVGSTIVFCCSIWLPSQDLAFLLASTVVCISLALSGGFLDPVKMNDIPSALQWLSPTKYSFQSLVIAHLKGTQAELIIEKKGYDNSDTISMNLSLLGAIIFLLSILSVIGMSRVREVK